MFFRLTRRLLLPLLSGALLAACVTTPPAPAYKHESFDSNSPFEYWSTREPGNACELGRRALLSQGYQVDEPKPQNIRGEKLFQPAQDYGMRLSINLVCLPSNVGTVIYANALQTRFALKAGGSSAGLSVAGIGSISLPWAADKDSLVKVGEETISDPDFYKRLFTLIESLDGGS
ncbi:DUF2242 domain-containing protein [Azospira sp. I13]|uniref:DUF2242 domain-containing protein n=1 Tax=Azospira sp. I13 TaxID=1765050 RepID=UPI000D5A1579|nr:DUF2242 domain-containing protein [Azospira sp. I13]